MLAGAKRLDGIGAQAEAVGVELTIIPRGEGGGGRQVLKSPA